MGSTMLGNVGSGLDSPRAALPLLVPAVVLVICCASAQVQWMNSALEACDCLTVVPLYYALAILVQAISAGVIFEEFARFTYLQAGGFLAGTVILLLGVYQLSRGHVDNDSGEISKLSVSVLDDGIPVRVRAQTARPPHRLWRHSRIRAMSTVVVQQKLNKLRRLRAGSSRRMTIG